MLLVVDTREQLSWNLAEMDLGGFVTGITSETLHCGDYSISGYQGRIEIERKSLGDLVQTLSRDWLRFRKKLWKLAGCDMAAIVAECTLADIIAHKYESDAHPNLILGRMNDCLVDHGVPCFCWGEREQAAAMAGRLLRKAVERV